MDKYCVPLLLWPTWPAAVDREQPLLFVAEKSFAVFQGKIKIYSAQNSNFCTLFFLQVELMAVLLCSHGGPLFFLPRNTKVLRLIDYMKVT